jgi:hypothetical protein
VRVIIITMIVISAVVTRSKRRVIWIFKQMRLQEDRGTIDNHKEKRTNVNKNSMPKLEHPEDSEDDGNELDCNGEDTVGNDCCSSTATKGNS